VVNKIKRKLSSLHEYSVLKKAFPEIPPILPFQREESFSFGSDKNSAFPSLGMKLDFKDFQKAKQLLSYKLTKLGMESK
jgi:hypothetical protein